MRCGKPSGEVDGDASPSHGGSTEHVTKIMTSERTYLPHGEQGGDMRSVEFDCCRACFLKHVVPAMVALGFMARKEDVDY